MIVVTASRARLEGTPAPSKKVEWIDLDYVAMARGHQRVRTDAGTEIAISLARGGHLSDGDMLYEDGERVILVRAAAEDALVIAPVDGMQWGLVGFQLGSRHCIAFFQPTAILVPYDHTLEAVLAGLGVPVRRERRPLLGIRASAHPH